MAKPVYGRAHLGTQIFHDRGKRMEFMDSMVSNGIHLFQTFCDRGIETESNFSN